MRITSVGHATFLIEYDKLTIITDPMFSNRIAYTFMRRRMPPKPRFDELPSINAVLISHWHLDHLDARTLKKFDRKIPIVINKALERTPKRLGFGDVRALEWWKGTQIDDLEITAVPAFHFSGRPPRFTKKDYQGYVIQKDNEKTVYFAGDTGLKNDFAAIGKKFEVDVALLPIGAYKPKSFRRHHLSPEDALEAKRILNAKILIPFHWGVFDLSWEPMEEPPVKLKEAAKEAGLEESVFILSPGESLKL